MYRRCSVVWPAQKKWGFKQIDCEAAVYTLDLSWKKLTLNWWWWWWWWWWHGTPSKYIKILLRICANLKRGLNISGGYGPTHSPVMTPLEMFFYGLDCVVFWFSLRELVMCNISILSVSLLPASYAPFGCPKVSVRKLEHQELIQGASIVRLKLGHGSILSN